MSTKSHWEKIYSEKSPQEVSWTQEIPETSIEFFNEFKLSKTSPIIDIGGGESKFVDFLLAEGYQNISVLDISENALKRAKDRLGEKSKNIEWIVCDINDFNSISSVINSFNPTHILHLAAATGMDVSNITHFKTNYDGVITLTKACKSSDTLKKIVFTGSYGSTGIEED